MVVVYVALEGGERCAGVEGGEWGEVGGRYTGVEGEGRTLALRLVLVSGSSLSGCVISDQLLNPFGSGFFVFLSIYKMGKIILLKFC